jgi:1-deoxy-D-xylulose 5-phosphate reductoisomerase
VAAFLENRIKFMDIPAIIDQILNNHNPVTVGELPEFIEADKMARKNTVDLINMKQK